MDMPLVVDVPNTEHMHLVTIDGEEYLHHQGVIFPDGVRYRITLFKAVYNASFIKDDEGTHYDLAPGQGIWKDCDLTIRKCTDWIKGSGQLVQKYRKYGYNLFSDFPALCNDMNVVTIRQGLKWMWKHAFNRNFENV